MNSDHNKGKKANIQTCLSILSLKQMLSLALIALITLILFFFYVFSVRGKQFSSPGFVERLPVPNYLKAC